nr:SPRY domain-containing protein 7-like [Penaeus vannamei]
MAMYLCCFRQLCGTSPRASVPIKTTPTIILDTGYMGHEVVIVKNGIRICGTGGALGNIPILQNKAYFEVKLQQSGVWGIGIATRNANLNKVPLGEDSQSWVLCSDGCVRHNGEEKYKIADIPQEGDILVSLIHQCSIELSMV